MPGGSASRRSASRSWRSTSREGVCIQGVGRHFPSGLSTGADPWDTWNTTVYSRQVGSMHPTGIHSCWKLWFSVFSNKKSHIITHPRVTNNDAPFNLYIPITYTVKVKFLFLHNQRRCCCGYTMVTTMFICVSPPLCSFQTTVFFLSPWSFENIIHINITRAPCYLNFMAGFQSCMNSKGTRFNGLFIRGISNNHDSKINHENIHSSFGLSTRQMYCLIVDSKYLILL